MTTDRERTANPPITSRLSLAYALSLAIAVLMAIASLTGLLVPTSTYPTDELRRSFLPNDVVNLCIGLPILIGSMTLARRGRLVGLLFWPGALCYVLYTYLIYVFSMPLNLAFLLHLMLVTLSAYAMAGLVASIDGQAVERRLAGAVPERLGGGVLAGLGVLFFVRVVVVLAQAILSQTPIAATELGLYVSDFC